MEKNEPREVACAEGVSCKYILTPLADTRYTIPREKKEDGNDDFLIRHYECEQGHRNTVYWYQKDIHIAGGPLTRGPAVASASWDLGDLG